MRRSNYRYPKLYKISAKKATPHTATAQIVDDLFEDAADAILRLQATFSRAHTARNPADLAAAIGGMRSRIDEIFLATDGIERLAAPQRTRPRFWLRIAGKKFYQSRSFCVSEDAANEIFRRVGRLETRDDVRSGR